MSTALDHRLVRGYLRDLDVALRALPAAQASELREQITAHLDEALDPDASDGEVAATLSRLGSPAGLAAEAVAAAGGGTSRAGVGAKRGGGTSRAGVGAERGWAPSGGGRGARGREKQSAGAGKAERGGGTSRAGRGRRAPVRRRTWVLAGVAVAVAATVAGYAVFYLTPGPLQLGTVATWWYPRDLSHRVDVSANQTMQSTVPIRSGQGQGYVVSLYNPSDVTQTVVADGSGPAIGWDNPGSTRGSHVAVSLRYWTPPDSLGYGLVHRVGYVLPGAIPPHQTRLVRVLWTSNLCLGKGESVGVGTLYLRVRVGWFTRTETIPLGTGWYLIGPSTGRCHG